MEQDKVASRIEKLLKATEDYVTPEDVAEAMLVLKQYLETRTEEISDDFVEAFETAVRKCEEWYMKTKKAEQRLNEKIESVKVLIGPPGKDGYSPLKGKDYDDGKTPSAEELRKLITPLIPDPIPGVPGQDGSPDTPDEVIGKIHRSELKIDKTKIDGIEDLERMARANANAVPATTSFINGQRAKNLHFTGASVSYHGDTATVAITGGGGSVESVNGQTGVVVLAASDIGLGNVDNTSDLAKPVSTATQTALDAKANSLGPDDNYVTDAQLVVLGNTSGTNTGDQVGDGVTITGAGTVGDPFVAVGSGSGDVVGPASATDNALARYDATTGKLIQDSSAILDDSGNLGLGVGTMSAKLHVLSTTAQQRTAYDASNYFDTTVASNGLVSFNAVGSGASFNFADTIRFNNVENISPNGLVITSYNNAMRIGGFNIPIEFQGNGTTKMLVAHNTNDVYMSSAVVSASPSSTAINGGGGSGTNIAGGALNIAGGKATGNAAGGPINFQTSAAGASGTTLQTLVTRLTVDGPAVISEVPIRLNGYTVATLPAGTQGDTAFVTDATAPTFLGALTGGGSVVTPVFYDGSAWVAG